MQRAVPFEACTYSTAHCLDVAIGLSRMPKAHLKIASLPVVRFIVIVRHV